MTSDSSDDLPVIDLQRYYELNLHAGLENRCA